MQKKQGNYRLRINSRQIDNATFYYTPLIQELTTILPLLFRAITHAAAKPQKKKAHSHPVNYSPQRLFSHKKYLFTF